jgi:hypothetical protein
MNSRYVGNEETVRFETMTLDVKAGVQYLRAHPGNPANVVRGLNPVGRQFRAALDAVERGEDAPGVGFTETDARVRTHAGNWREDPCVATLA